MNRRGTALLSVSAAACFLAVALPSSRSPSPERIRVIPNEASHTVDIVIDAKPFTSYIWPDRLAKPVLYPLRTPHGALVTRGFPLDPRPGERIDHPHQVGLWFTYGNVNGFDFWNNSEAIKPEDLPKMGNIRHRAITAVKSGADSGQLEIDADWITEQQLILKEHTRFVFRGGPDFRSIDRITTLRALDSKVVFADDKEGLLGIRVTRALELPSDKPEVFTDASGHPTTVAKLDNTGVNGIYLTSEGKTGDAAWGTRGRWCALNGKIGDEPVTVAIFDHPGNPGYPTYWHARGYGLFAANPLGQKIFSNGKEEINLSIAPKHTVTFCYRVLISSKALSSDDMEVAFIDFMSSCKWGKGHPLYL